jgi:pyruvate/2-oxoacid:ferredoxin oxidoreductase beta subunit
MKKIIIISVLSLTIFSCSNEIQNRIDAIEIEQIQVSKDMDKIEAKMTENTEKSKAYTDRLINDPKFTGDNTNTQLHTEFESLMKEKNELIDKQSKLRMETIKLIGQK